MINHIGTAVVGAALLWVVDWATGSLEIIAMIAFGVIAFICGLGLFASGIINIAKESGTVPDSLLEYYWTRWGGETPDGQKGNFEEMKAWFEQQAAKAKAEEEAKEGAAA